MKGRVLRSTGKWYTVQIDPSKEIIACRIRGKLRLEDVTTTNPIAVGDWVSVEYEDGLTTGLITKIHTRNNYIIRQSPRKKWQQQIIAANIDQALLLITFSRPRTSLGFIGRFLVTAEMYHIPVGLVFNKQDLYKRKDMARYEEISQLYESLGYPCILVSAVTGYQIEALEELMRDKTSLLSGHSGVGKSSLVNRIHPELNLNTKQVSTYSDKGVHTTTFATMYEMPFDGYIIDSPGIKEFGLVHLEPEEVSHYFKEMKPLINDCKFNNCLHRNEPGCAIKTAVVSNKIHVERYKNYLSILDDIEAINYWERK